MWVRRRVATIGLPGAEVLIDLQRRIGTAAAGRHERVGGIEERGDLFGRPLPGKDHGTLDARAARVGARRLDLIRTSPRQHEPRIRPSCDDVARGVEEKIEPLVRLEGAGVEHERRRRAHPELLAHPRPRPCDRTVTRSRRVLDQHRRHRALDLADRIFQVLANDDDDLRSPDDEPLHPRKRAAQHLRLAERKVRQLLRKARVHVVEMRNPEHRREHDADEASLFMRVDHVVAFRQGAPQRRHGQREIERRLREGRPDAHLADERRTQAAKHTQPRHRHIPPERIRDEVNRMPQLEECPDAVIFAEGCAPGLKERLRRNHEDLHSGAEIVPHQPP